MNYCRQAYITLFMNQYFSRSDNNRAKRKFSYSIKKKLLKIL